MQDDNETFYTGTRREALVTLACSGLTMLALLAAGYFAPDLLAAALH